MLRSILCAAAVLAGAAWSGAGLAQESGAPYGRRDPAVCEPLRQAGPPSIEQAVQLVRCEREDVTYTEELWLMEDMSIRFGDVTTWADMYDEMDLPYSDPSKPVYRIHGAFTWLTCRTLAAAGPENCREVARPEQDGACWESTLKGWTCFLRG